MNIAAHPVTPEQIMALLDAELTSERSRVVEAHLEQCASCGSVAKTLRGSSEKLVGWMVPEMPTQLQFEAGLWETARRVSAERAKGLASTWTFVRRHWIAAAVSAICVFWLFSRTTERFAAPPFEKWGNPDGSEIAASKTRTVKEIGELPAKPTLSLSQSTNGELGRLDNSGTFSLPNIPAASPRPAPPAPEEMIARTVTLNVVAKDFVSARGVLDSILAKHHGYAATLTVNTQRDSARSLVASLRIPAAELNAAVAELKSLGPVQNETQGGEEVTQQHADLVARLKNSRETERRLQAILENRTGKISDVLEVEQEIARVRGEIEQMEGEQKALEHRVSFATIDLNLSEEYKAQIGQPSPSVATRIHNARVVGYRDAMENLVGLVLLGAEYGPSAVIWLALLTPVAWMVRRRWLKATAVVQSVRA